MDDHEADVVHAMMKYGGGFVKKLGELFQHADSGNTRVLKEAFPQYWQQYEKIAEQLKKKM